MIVQANAIQIPLAPGSVHCCISSPPYWGLRSYDAGDMKHLELGLEPVPDCGGAFTGAPCGECFVCHMVAVFREVWRVLRDDGTCWLNLGDSYAGHNPVGWRPGNEEKNGGASNKNGVGFVDGLKPKDLCGIPWRVALALQADGWYLRSDIIWAKPNPMPESVTDRPTKAHEYVFLLAKRERYFYDSEAVREPLSTFTEQYLHSDWGKKDAGKIASERHDAATLRGTLRRDQINPAGRNRRTVWTVATAPYAGAHYAVFPPALVEPMILAGTSARGVCSQCGAPWERVTERTDAPAVSHKGSRFDTGKTGTNGNGRTQAGERHEKIATGWRPTCTCYPRVGEWRDIPPRATDAEARRIAALQSELVRYWAPMAADTVPAIVLDPFCGSGTTGAVAREHGRRFVGLDISLKYLRENALPRAERRNTDEALTALPLFANATA